jgi:predicted Ser/Thr protein kinase
VNGAVPTVGETFGGYTITALLGRGGMGTVYLARHRRLDRDVALKVIAPELAYDEAFRARFLRESQLAASLDHPHVIPIYDADEVDGVLYIAMRYVKGPSLRELLRERGTLSSEETARIAGEIGGALDAAHAEGLVHRDVKPANILLAQPGDHAYLCDFGLAKRTGTPGTTHTGSFLGTADYSAPEQIEGRALDGRADVYSLGAVVFHCLTGRAPFAGDSELAVLQAHLTAPPPIVSRLRPGLPAPVDTIVETALAKDPHERYATAGGFAAALRDALEGRSPDSPTRVAPPLDAESGETVARVPDARRPPRRLRIWVAASLGLVVAIAGAAVVAVLATRGSEDDAARRTFVDRVENVLEQSAAGRREVGAAIGAGLDCSISPEEAARRIASAADNRQSILVQLGNLQAPTADDADIVTLLQRALQESIEADRHYRDAFLAVEPGARCPLERNPSFGLAAAADARATAAKVRFVKAFNPLAERFGRPTWSAGKI